MRGIIAATLVALMTVGTAALADDAAQHKGPPPLGAEVGFANPYIVCNTKEQIEAIAKSGHDSSANSGIVEKFMELHALKDAKGEATCAYVPIGTVVVGENESLGVLMSAAGAPSNSWAVHFGNAHGDWWMLFAQPAEDSTEAPRPDPSSFSPQAAVKLPDMCEGRSASSFDKWTHTRRFWCS